MATDKQTDREPTNFLYIIVMEVLGAIQMARMSYLRSLLTKKCFTSVSFSSKHLEAG